MKWFSLGILIIILIAVFSDAMADDPHERDVPSETIVYTDSQGVASAIASAQCNFDNSSNALQVCAAMGFSDGNQAQAAGIAKKYKGFLLNGSVSTESGVTRYGVGLTIKVK